MQTDLIIIDDYCQKCNIEPSFIFLLEEGGLINIKHIDGEHYILTSELQEIERFSRWYYDLSINVEGISVIHNLLKRIHSMEAEIRHLKQHINFFQQGNNNYPEY